MISKTNILTGAMVALLIGGIVAATPASAWTRYHNNTGAIVGAAIGGMALGAAIGAATRLRTY
jgi:outer membrane lipoprotein SlyB